MSKINDMIKELCPEGLQWDRLENVCKTITPPQKLKTNEYLSSGEFLVIDQGQNSYAGYTDNEDVLLPLDEYVLYGDHTCTVKYVNVPFAQGADGLKILKAKNVKCKYLYYAICVYNLDNTEYKRHWTQAKDIRIPLPPLSIQQEIVSVLDSFTTLIDKMKQEVEKRKMQMAYYRDMYYGGDIEGMMSLANNSSTSVITFAELGTITRGKRFVRDDVRESGQPCIHYGDMYTYYGTKSYQANTFLDRDYPKNMRYANKGDVVIVGAGENDYDIGVGVVWMGDEPAAVHDACYILGHKQNPMYISHYLRSNIYHQQLKKYVSSGKISSFSAEGLGKVYIPIQPTEKQAEIASTLDKFESYIMKLEKMITLRQKQYEYYREQLLTFNDSRMKYSELSKYIVKQKTMTDVIDLENHPSGYGEFLLSDYSEDLEPLFEGDRELKIEEIFSYLLHLGYRISSIEPID